MSTFSRTTARDCRMILNSYQFSRWLAPPNFPRPIGVHANRFEIFAYGLPDGGRLANYLAAAGPQQFPETDFFIARLQEAVSAWEKLAPSATLVVLRNVLSGSALDGEVTVSLKTRPPWLLKKRFLQLIKLKAPELSSLSPAEGIMLMLGFYQDERADGCEIDEDGDMLLYQWGCYDWGQGESFEFNITRQFIAATAEDEDIRQLSLKFKFKTSEPLRT